MKKTALMSGILLVIICFVSCAPILGNNNQQDENESTTTTTTTLKTEIDEDGTSTTTTTVASNGSNSGLTAYRKIQLSDFPALGSDYNRPSGTDVDDLYIFQDTMQVAAMYLESMLEEVFNDTPGATISPKSIEASIEFHMLDEGFTVNPISPSSDEQYVDFLVKHLDLVAEGRLNNFTKFLLAMNDAYDPAEDELSAETHTGISLFFQGGSEDENTKLFLSLFAQLDVEINDLESGVVSGKLSAGFGTNHLLWFNDNLDTLVDKGQFPYVIQLEVRPFNGVSIAKVQQAIDLWVDDDGSMTADELWDNFCDLIWGDHDEEYYIRAAIFEGDSNGNAINGMPRYIDDLELLNAL